jgi:SAM-dependent methyltransferase
MYMRYTTVGARLRRLREEEGRNVPRIVRRLVHSARHRYEIYRRNRAAGVFVFRGQAYRYFHHEYNATSLNERIVEIPIAKRLLRDYRGRRILEIGNVLSHYGMRGHTVVDKYERARGVINVDVVDFTTEDRFDLIVSISTLEHVGWDEEVRDPGKIPRALEHLRRLLAPGGRLVMTFGAGYNEDLDALLASQRLPLTDVAYMKRVSADNTWEETSHACALAARYDEPFPYANALVYAEVHWRPVP